MTRTALAALLALAPAAAAAQARTAAPAAATSSWEAAYDAAGDETRHTLVNRSFLRASSMVGAGPVELLIAQEVRTTVRNDREGAEGRVRATAYTRQGRAYRRVQWTVDAPGTDGGVEGNTYWVQEPACCATVPTRRYFSLATGRPILHATSAVAVVAEGDDAERRVAFLSASGSAQHPALRGARNAVGLLQLAAGDAVRQTLLVASDRAELQGDAAVLGVAVGSGTPPYTVWLRFTDGTEARIPLGPQGFVWNDATLPQGMAVSLVR